MKKWIFFYRNLTFITNYLIACIVNFRFIYYHWSTNRRIIDLFYRFIKSKVYYNLKLLQIIDIEVISNPVHFVST